MICGRHYAQKYKVLFYFKTNKQKVMPSNKHTIKTSLQTNKQTNEQTQTNINKQTNKHKQTYKQTSLQTNKRTNKRTNVQAKKNRIKVQQPKNECHQNSRGLFHLSFFFFS